MNDVLLVLGVIILTYGVLRLAGRRRGDGASLEPAPQWPQRASGSRPVREDLEQLTAQLEDVGREIEARLDTRIRYARRLLEESEQVLYQLEARVAEAKDAIEGRVRLTSPAEDDPESAQQPSPIAELPESSSEPDHELPALAATAERSPPPDGDESDDHREIAALATQGMGPGEIARKVGRPIGEVELILALQRQNHAR